MTQTFDAPSARFALSLAQQDIYFDQLHAPTSPHYNVGGIITFKHADAAIMQAAHRLMITHSEVFGLTIATDEQGVYQWVNPTRNCHIDFEDLSAHSDAKSQVHRWANAQFSQTMPLEHQPLYRAKLYRVDDDTLWYVMLAHHLIMDGFGFVNWADHLSYYYQQQQQNPNCVQPLEAISWQALVESDQQYLESKRYPKDREFWQQHLKTLPQPLLQPHYQHQYDENLPIPSHREVVDLDPQSFKQWQQQAEASGVGLQSWFLAILALYHARVDGRDHINIGSALHNRKTHAQKQMLGTFTSVSPVPCRIAGVTRFAELAQQIAERQKSSYRHGRYPFGHMLRDFGISGHHGGLFDVQLNYLSLATNNPLHGHRATILRKPHGYESVPLVVTLLEASEGKPAIIEMDVNLAYFTALEAKRLVKRYLHLAEQVAQNPNSDIFALELMPKEEQMLLTEQWQGQPLAASLPGTVVELYQRQLSTASQPAVIFGDTQLSYQALNQQANQIARQLQHMGVKPGDSVGLSLPRRPLLFSALLAIFKSGASCVPLDPDYPKARLEYIVNDSQIKWLITDTQGTQETAPVSAANVLNLSEKAQAIALQSNADLPLPQAEDIAYIIYTSGSTGKPKGVALSHQALSWHIQSIAKGYQIVAPERIAVFTSINFDPFMEQTWLAWHSGGSAVLLDSKLHSGTALLDQLNNQKVTIADLPPSYFEQLTLLPGWDLRIKGSALKALIFGGEALNGNLIKLWQQHGLFEQCRLINSYGPTEACITASFAELSVADQYHPPIGTLPPARLAYVLDAQGRLLPSGSVGELYLGGPMLAQGYLNQPEQTAQKFVEINLSGQTLRLYRSGDKVKQLDNGALVYIGRLDEQVKIRGFRVEPGEITAELNRIDNVESAIVVARETQAGPMQLVAYIQLNNSNALSHRSSIAAIKHSLEQRLPHYMVPSHLVLVERWPLSVNGKIDTMALPAPSGHSELDYIAPQSPLEHSLQCLWAEILALTPEQISTNANFFDLGGHSLLAVRAIGEISQQLGRTLTVADLFAAPDIKQLAQRVECAPLSDSGPIGARDKQDKSALLPLSFAQQQLWLVDKLASDNSHYHMQVAYEVTGKLDGDKLERSIIAIIEQHLPLRTVIVEQNQQPWQQQLSSQSFALERHDLLGQSAVQQQQAIDQLIAADRQHSFDLQKALPIRVMLVQLAPLRSVLVFNFHHIAMDGWSLDVFFQALSASFSGEPVAQTAIDYGDYALWQRQHPHYQTQLDYWLNQLEDMPLEHGLPLKGPRPRVKNTEAGLFALQLTTDELGALQQLARQHNITLFMLLHGTLAQVISAHANSATVAIGTPVANRERPELNALIGLFVNTVVLKTQHHHSSFAALLAHIKAVHLSAQANQSLPFEHLVARSNLERNSAINPLFQIMFSLDDALSPPNLEGLKLRQKEQKLHRVKFDLDITATTTEQGLHLSWLFDNQLFAPALIEQMASHWRQLLKAALNAQPLSLLDSAQTERLLALSQAPVSHSLNCASLAELFAKQAQAKPRALAIKDHQQALSFAELDLNAQRLASALQAQGVIAGDLVAIILPHSVNTLVAMLAIWRCHAAFVPIDPNYPKARIDFVLQDTQAKIAISQEGQLAIDCPQLSLAALEAAEPADRAPAILNPLHPQPEQLAYVIYTSGSTGQPKGVMVEHRQLTNLAAQMAHWPIWPTRAEGALAQVWGWVANPVFDAAMQAVVQVMLGHPVYVIDEAVKLAPEQLALCIAKENLAVIDCTPSILRSWLAGNIAAQLPNLVIGGEAIDSALWQQLVQWQQENGTTALNVYGPTECCVNSTMAQIQGKQPTIGRAIGNAQALLLTANGQLAPALDAMGGAAAELYIGGAGVARGYLNQPRLTAERFIDSPYGRLYRTGDHVRLLDNGELHYLGRGDSQIKLRGYRIEPGEIEQALISCNDIKDAKVLLGQAQQLLAFVVGENTEQALFEQLKQLLPKHLHPAAITVLPSWPLTPSGKIDLKALSELEQAKSLRAPGNGTEQKLMVIWQQLLEQRQPLDIDTSFYALGGHSLLATRLASQLKQHFNVDFALKALFEHTTIATQAQWLSTLEPTEPLSKIAAIPRQGHYALSPAQQRLWFIDSLEGQSSQYNMVGSYHLTGALDLTALQSALDSLVARHEILRTNYICEQDQPYALIRPAQPVNIIHQVLSSVSEAEQEKAVQQCITDAHLMPMDLAHDPLLQVQLLELAERSHVLILKVHHIAADGWSVALILDAINQSYNAILLGKNIAQEVPVLQYIDYAHWQNQQLSAEQNVKDLAYWRNQLEGIPQLHGLPLDNPRPSTPNSAGAKHHVTLSGSEALERLAEQNDSTLFMLLQTAFALLLSRYSGEQDIVMGTPVAGRTADVLEPMLGFFVNTLVLRTELEPSQTLRELLAYNRNTILDGFNHQQLPFESLVEALNPVRSNAAAPVFQILFTLHNQAQQPLGLNGLVSKEIVPNYSQIKFDLELDISQSGNDLDICWHYSAALFNKDTIERMAQNYLALIEQLPHHLDTPLSDIAMLCANERQRLFEQWAQRPFTLAPRWHNAHEFCIHQLFEQQAERTPDKLAVAIDDDRLSYGELNHRANHLAALLLNQGVRPQQPVGLYLTRSSDLMVSIIAVLKAGGAYVAIDPGYPIERIRYILSDTNAPLVLTQSALVPDLAGLNSLCVDALQYPAGSQAPKCSVSPASLAYLIYTSGSTGRPKGAMISHANVVNLLTWYITEYQLNQDDNVLVFSSTSFDLTQKNLLAPLLCGATLHFASAREYDPIAIVDTIARQNISFTNCAPSAFYPLFDAALELNVLNSLRYVLLGGEPIDMVRFEPWLAQCDATLVNMYGPTECTDIACAYSYQQGMSHNGGLPIGTPNRNVRLYVLAPNSQTPLPQGAAGELCIGGAGVTLGYLNQPALSAEKFVLDPFAGVTGAKMYRTGDLVRWHQDGRLHFIGRIDHQVKIRGLRIELGEIEARLSELSMVKQAVVLAQPVQNQPAQLVAYVVPQRQHPQLEPMLQAALKLHLPDYMVPQHFMLLDSLPLTPNSKVDRKTLATLFEPKVQQYVAPQNALEQKLQRLWGEVLSLEPLDISCDANFFTLGGHSLLVAKLIHLAAKQFALSLSVKDIFSAPTIIELAQQLSHKHHDTGLSKQLGNDPVPLSYAQYRVWFVEQMQPQSNQNNMTAGLKLKGQVDVAKLQACFATLIKRHDILRTHLIANDEQPLQVCQEEGVVAFDYHDLTGLNGELKTQQADALVLAHNTTAFELTQLPLIKALVVRLDEHNLRLHLCCHHLICDGWSQTQLLSELFALYDNTLSATGHEPPYSYRDYVLWQQNYLNSDKARQSELFWQQYLKDCPRQLTLPFETSASETEHSERAAQSFDDFSLDKKLEQPLSAALKTLAQAHKGSLFNVLHCAFNVLLTRLSGQASLLTGIAVSGRDLSGSEALVGNLLNNLPVKAEIDLNASFSHQLEHHVLDIQALLSHQSLPFEKILAQSQVSRSNDETPLFQVFFNMLSLPPIDNQPKDFSYSSDLTAAIDNKFKLSLYAQDTPAGVQFHCNFNRALLSRDAIELLLSQYVQLLKLIAADSGLACGQYPLRTEPQTLPNPQAPIALNGPFVSVAERFAAQDKNRTALVYQNSQGEDVSISYGELDGLSNHFASTLQQQGVVCGDVVGIFTERTPQLIVATLGCLKAGAAFMMLSKTTPQAMLDLQLAQVPAKVLIELNQVAVEAKDDESAEHEFTPVAVSADGLAYIAFTSGTEGKPKAVMGRHSSLSSFMPSFAKRFALSAQDNFALLSGLVHDPLQRDMFTPLCLGACLHIPANHLMGTPAMPDWLRAHQISVVHLTPSLGEQLLAISERPIASLRRGFFVGEVLTQDQFNRFSAIAPNMQVVNLYGSTETGRAVSYHLAKPQQHNQVLPLGHGIDGCQLLLLNQAMQPCALGEVGQIGMRSCHLSLGYMNDEALTQARFIDNPFGDGQIYLTGDLGRDLPDGNVEYLGRADNQIKIRGFRVELAHISHVLEQHPSVKQAAVIACGDSSQQVSLSAFVCGVTSLAECDDIALWLKDQLPDYMQPDDIQHLAALPLTQNGKLDRKALAQIPKRQQQKTLVAPTNDIERSLLEIWQSLLEQQAISTEDDFFAIGGHSLLATRLFGRIKQHFAVDIGFSAFFADSRLCALAAHIGQQMARNHSDSDTAKQVLQQQSTKKNTLTL